MLINVAFPIFAPSDKWNQRFEELNYDVDQTNKEVGSPYLSNQHKELKVRDGVYYTGLNPDSWFKHVGIDIYPSYDTGHTDAHALWKYRDEYNLKFIPLSGIVEMIRLSRYGSIEHVDYGVCDNVEQILAKWPHLESSTQRHFITLTPIYRKHQPSYDGWRWHKWGQYIGNHKPEHEYLYNEEGIDVVYVFQIYTLKPSSGYGRPSFEKVS